MSKITKALQKAARERLRRLQEQPTVASAPVAVALAAEPGAVAVEHHVQVDPHIVSATDPKSPIAEQYRILRTNIQALRLRAGPKTLVVTSAVHGEGKSVTAINLALTLARQEHLRVVLVDADMRKSSVQRWLGLSTRAHGLSTVLAQGGELNGSLVRLASPPVTILPAGPLAENPAELLESSGMKRLLGTLKGHYDIILMDAPPVLPVTDPSILASVADGVLLVVRAGKTQRKTVVQAQRLLQQAKANVIGCVLTHVEYYLPGYYRYYRYRYGATQHEQDGGATPDAVAAAPNPPGPSEAAP